ncbi:MAG: DUF4292 domain-containing protein [Sphingobacteriaceae bacterium]
MNLRHTPLRLFISCSILLLFLAGCSAKRKVVKVDKSAIERSTAEKLAAIEQTQVHFDRLSLKSKASISLDGNANDVSVAIRMENNQKIWISVTAIAGLEVARMLITPDSIKIINRLESVYIKKPFSFIHAYTNPQVNFGTLQAMLVGNVWPEIFKQTQTIDSQDVSIRLLGQLSSIQYDIRFNEGLKMNNLHLQDTMANQELQVSYADFWDEGGQLIPHQLQLSSLVGSKSVQAELKYTKVEKDIPLDFPFNVPKRFSVKN